MSTQLRVWHIPQVPGKPFVVPVESPEEANKVLEILAMYDQFQYQNHIKPDFCNAQGLSEFFPEEVIETGSEDDCDGWLDWHSEDDEELEEYLESKGISIEPLNLRELNRIKF